jgi:hypothetical protein
MLPSYMQENYISALDEGAAGKVYARGVLNRTAIPDRSRTD